MKYVVCPTCGKVLADVELEYEAKNLEITSSKLSDKEKVDPYKVIR